MGSGPSVQMVLIYTKKKKNQAGQVTMSKSVNSIIPLFLHLCLPPGSCFHVTVLSNISGGSDDIIDNDLETVYGMVS